MMVVVVVMGIVSTVIFASVLALTRAADVADQSASDQGFARNAITLLSRNVRAAAPVQQSNVPAFRHAGRDAATFTANLTQGTDSTLVHVEVDADRQVVVTTTPPDPASTAPDLVFDPADQQVRRIASHVVNTGPVFEYFAADDRPLTSFGPDGSLPVSDRRQIAFVRIVLDLNGEPRQTDATRLSTTVRLPNAGIAE